MKLVYFTDQKPGITRLLKKGNFIYLRPGGSLITAATTLTRIQALVIPPAWESVWICLSAHGYLQATGRDARGRKQYRYHTLWRKRRERAKFGRVADFARALPRLRRKVRDHLALPGLPREKVLAAVVRLLDTSLIRIGNDEYARDNHSFGLTTLRNHHAAISGSSIRFAFRGKSGKKHVISLEDKPLARILRKCQELPGQELFEYFDENGRRHDVGSGDVNAYIRDLMDGDYTAKDFRLWHGTVLAASALRKAGPPPTATSAKRTLVQAVKDVAARLGNTPAVCRGSYIHPEIFRAYESGQLPVTAPRRIAGLNTDENLTLVVLTRPR